MQANFFPNQTDFRDWLEVNHEKESELLVGFYKVASRKPSMTWSESVDQALCFGWIDGIRRSIDGESYSIRFTPRKSKSIWSAVNIAKIGELTKKGLIMPAGIAAFAKRDEHRSAIYAYENKPGEFPEDFERRFSASGAAWEFFNRQPAGYRKMMMYWVLSAKQVTTRLARLEKLITESGHGKRL